MSPSKINQEILNQLITTTDSEFVGELIEAYLEDSPKLIGEMKDALEQNDPALFRRAAHTLKSSSASLGAMVLSERSKELEMIGRSGDLSQADGKLDQLVSEFDQVERELKASAQ